jgi:polyisoprenoid-binding protein YceI
MRLILILALILTANTALAAPEVYTLQPDLSSVGFETDFGPDKITGSMPVAGADLTLDFAKVAASKVAVTLNAAGAQASFPFAAQAMKGPKVLDTAEFPEISFVSTAVKPEAQGATVSGKITIRGVTRPASFHAEIYRQQGTEAGDLSHLTIRMTGAVMRSDFGAVGWNDMVGDQVRLDILARIERAN